MVSLKSMDLIKYTLKKKKYLLLNVFFMSVEIVSGAEPPAKSENQHSKRGSRPELEAEQKLGRTPSTSAHQAPCPVTGPESSSFCPGSINGRRQGSGVGGRHTPGVCPPVMQARPAWGQTHGPRMGLCYESPPEIGMASLLSQRSDPTAQSRPQL